MKKFRLEEIESMDLAKVEVKELANSKSIDDCKEDVDLDTHLSEMETMLSKYSFPCLLKMSSNTDRVDYSIMQNVSDVIEYCGEFLDNKNGTNAYWDKDNELLIKVWGQSFQRTSDKTYHFVTQYVKLFNIDNKMLNGIKEGK